MFDQEVFILKLRTVDRLAPRPIKPLKISSLQHELRDNPVKYCVLVAEPLLVPTRCDGHKVCNSSRHNLVKKLHVDNSIVFVIGGYSELHLGSLRLLLRLLSLDRSGSSLRYRCCWLLELLLPRILELLLLPRILELLLLPRVLELLLLLLARILELLLLLLARILELLLLLLLLVPLSLLVLLTGEEPSNLFISETLLPQRVDKVLLSSLLAGRWS